MSNLSDAIEYSVASGDDNHVEVVTFEGSHPDFDESIYLVMGTDDDLALPLNSGGSLVTHTSCNMDFKPPGFDKDGPIDGNITIENVSGLINTFLKQIVNPIFGIAVTIRRYILTPAPNYVTPTSPDEISTGLEIRSITLTATTATGSLSYPDIRDDNFPLKIYTVDEYAGLIGY